MILHKLIKVAVFTKHYAKNCMEEKGQKKKAIVGRWRIRGRECGS